MARLASVTLAGVVLVGGATACSGDDDSDPQEDPDEIEQEIDEVEQELDEVEEDIREETP